MIGEPTDLHEDGAEPLPEKAAGELALDADSFDNALQTAIGSGAAQDHVLVLLKLDDGGPSSEAGAMVPQLAELLRGDDLIARTAPGSFAILLHNRSIAQVTRMMATIDFLRGQLRLPGSDGPPRGPTRMSTTFLKNDDTPADALTRAQTKLDRFFSPPRKSGD